MTSFDRAPSGRPEAGEFADYAAEDIAQVSGDDVTEVLARQERWTCDLFRKFGDRGGDLAYAPGKWTIKQLLGHLADDERIFAYRALCVARGDDRELPGFDENAYMSGARFGELPMEAVLEDYRAVRAASITLFRGLDARAWLRRGTVNGYVATPRGLGFHIAGHELHHHRIVEERYVPLAARESWWPLS